MAVESSFTSSTREIVDLFADYMEGDANRPAVVLSAGQLGDTARNALERSLEAFGYQAPTCSYVTLAAGDASVEGGDIALDGQAAFMLVEALDPLFVIAADSAACAVLAAAYRTQFPTDSAIRVFGRSGVAFANLASLLESERGKQGAWRLLKSLNA